MRSSKISTPPRATLWERVAQVLVGAGLGVIAVHNDDVELEVWFDGEKFRHQLVTVALMEHGPAAMTGGKKLLTNEHRARVRPFGIDRPPGIHHVKLDVNCRETMAGRETAPHADLQCATRLD